MFEKKKEILKCLNLFLNKVNSNEVRVIDNDLPSVTLWCYYTEYLNQIMNIYSSENNQGEFNKLFDLAELDQFCVDAHKDEEYSKQQCVKYVERIKEKIQ